ncbi:PIN domain-containing protein [Lederbergia sp. NSJ-179]|uniref:PIN domain-containing protein n=1 Tax=Lederbergia sp. NSJ-179 TaxID=2931402 RepID=UPI001FD3822C|nr:PIN domain-containing protein [Lederbergia sp. NSJ-179]MCJ7840737.1 PIN domain-containing protein [Lederbergia sp. NSJ-179]
MQISKNLPFQNRLRYQLRFYKADYFLQTVLKGDPVIIADVTTAIRSSTLQIFEQYRNHKISYCDALSVEIMKEQQIQKIFAFDQQFEEVKGVQLIRL